MFNKRFLIPVLAIVAFGLPAGATVATYCAGTGCGTENASAFATDLGTDGYMLGSIITFSNTNGILAGPDYTDNASGVLFADFLGQSLAFNGTALTTPTTGMQPNYIEITLPMTIAAIQLAVAAPQGICLDAACPAGQTSGFVGFINSDPTAAWTVEIGVASQGSFLEINSFSVATSSQGSDTPEIGTLLLIGSGLIAMRWMKRWPRLLFRTPHPAC
ncbi:MAG TPA: hypothetical protein VK752_16720 [Bryobacteraceae bacterium]|jgi:hypothetical protein|nr:hypothetical protein [Bryobacteraceae bacterium]